MTLEIGLTEGVYDLLELNNVNQAIDLQENRDVQIDEAIEGTVWFNVKGKKKIRLELTFEEIETETATSALSKIIQYSIPDYLLPVFVKFTSARLEGVNKSFTEYTEYEGLANLYLTRKQISNKAPTLRDFTLIVYALE